MSYDPEESVTCGDITLSAVDALQALWENSKTQGISWMAAPTRTPTRDDFKARLLDEGWYADCVAGRVIKVMLKGELDLRLYDRDLGPGAGERALRAKFNALHNHG